MGTEALFNASRDEFALIRKIVGRASLLVGPGFDRQSLTMDLDAAHSNGNPIDFRALLNADDFNFAHDVFGIMRHIDRETGELRDFFLPRFSKHEAEV